MRFTNLCVETDAQSIIGKIYRRKHTKSEEPGDHPT